MASPSGLPAYGYAVLAYLALKLGLACLYQPVSAQRADHYRVAAVVTAHNETPETFRRCLDSLLLQTRRPDVLTIVDDGSAATDCLDLAYASRPDFEELGTMVAIVRHRQNRGKRQGLAAGFRRACDADLYVCIDSDTELKFDAVEKCLRYLRIRPSRQ